MMKLTTSRFDLAVKRALIMEGLFTRDEAAEALKVANRVRKLMLPALTFMKSCAEFAAEKKFISKSKADAVEKAYAVLSSDKLDKLLSSKKLANVIASVQRPLEELLKLLKKLKTYQAIAKAAKAAANGDFAEAWIEVKNTFAADMKKLVSMLIGDIETIMKSHFEAVQNLKAVIESCKSISTMCGEALANA